MNKPWAMDAKISFIDVASNIQSENFEIINSLSSRETMKNEIWILS
jgi:hypothetical protein